MKGICLSVVVAGGLLVFAGSEVRASGSYTTPPVRPPSKAGPAKAAPVKGDSAQKAKSAEKAKTLDTSKYELGKQIYTGNLAVSERTVRGATRVESLLLSELQAQLPKAARESADLPSYAGRLTPEQRQALIYYVKTRYEIETIKPSDKKRYELGDSIVSGKLATGPASSDQAPRQERVLKQLERLLSKADRERAALPSLAGKLTADQMQAVTYYAVVQSLSRTRDAAEDE